MLFRSLQRRQLGTKALDLELPPGTTIAGAWAALAAAHPVLAPAGPTIRFARNAVYADPETLLHDGDELALIPPVAGGADAPAHRRIELCEAPFDDGIASALQQALASDEDGAVVVFVGRTRVTPGTPAPGQEAEAARHAGARVVALDYEAFEPMALEIGRAHV